MARADIGVFGGSGFYEFLSGVEEVWVDTPYGAPSDKMAIAEIGGKRVAFLPRHGKDHRLPPLKINCRTNLWSMEELRVQRIVVSCAASSLLVHVMPVVFVYADQSVHRTWGREDTSSDGTKVIHGSPAYPYCPQSRQVLSEQAENLG